jgi:NADH dehydrogenase/NADH:ubiquinone oxidoreductase subunit G
LETVWIEVDGQKIETQKGKSVLEASLESGIYIPHLCYHPMLSPAASCRLCVVEISGIDGPVTSCNTPVSEGMMVRTKSDKINQMRKLAMELMLAGHPVDCSTCIKYLNCEFQSLKQYLVNDEIRF